MLPYDSMFSFLNSKRHRKNKIKDVTMKIFVRNVRTFSTDSPKEKSPKFPNFLYKLTQISRYGNIRISLEMKWNRNEQNQKYYDKNLRENKDQTKRRRKETEENSQTFFA